MVVEVVSRLLNRLWRVVFLNYCWHPSYWLLANFRSRRCRSLLGVYVDAQRILCSARGDAELG
jgi:hypothetical protein